MPVLSAPAASPPDASYLVTAAHAGLSGETVITAPATGGIIGKFIRKANDETVNNSDTLQDDDELILPVAANEKWVFEIVIFMTSGTTPDIKFALTVPSGATADWTLVPHITTASAISDSFRGGAGTAHSSSGQSNRMVVGKGEIEVGATPGNVVLQWAQNTANASDTKVQSGSYIQAWKVA